MWRETLELEPHLSVVPDFISTVEKFYASLVVAAAPSFSAADLGSGPTRGGKLLYAGELDRAGRALVVAGNIAGVASLCASADRGIQKQAVRDGVVDFLVTSLDEALRILKNEIRKGETVAVCVGADPVAMERAMRERGVAPDLLRAAAAFGDFGGPGQIIEADSAEGRAWLTWTVESAAPRWLPKIDAIALDYLDPNAFPARCWLERAPRYLGRLANGVHSLRCDREFLAVFVARVREQVARREIGVQVEIHASVEGTSETYRFLPPESAVSAS
jgi:hypothetical protein